jgi:hypothetical protein
MKTLRLPLEKKWFELTKSGEKTEDYREMTHHWISRLCKKMLPSYVICGDIWEYGTCGGGPARRHKKRKNVQFILWKKGDQNNIDGIGHLEDKWVNFDKSWWNEFTPH